MSILRRALGAASVVHFQLKMWNNVWQTDRHLKLMLSHCYHRVKGFRDICHPHDMGDDSNPHSIQVAEDLECEVTGRTQQMHVKA